MKDSNSAFCREVGGLPHPQLLQLAKVSDLDTSVVLAQNLLPPTPLFWTNLPAFSDVSCRIIYSIIKYSC